MNKNKHNAGFSVGQNGIPIYLLLTIFFVLMKINVFAWKTAIMTWSWWWVFSPVWIPFALTIGIILIIFIIWFVIIIISFFVYFLVDFLGK